MSFLSFISWKDEGGFEASWQPVLRTLPPMEALHALARSSRTFLYNAIDRRVCGAKLWRGFRRERQFGSIGIAQLFISGSAVFGLVQQG